MINVTSIFSVNPFLKKILKLIVLFFCVIVSLTPFAFGQQVITLGSYLEPPLSNTNQTGFFDSVAKEAFRRIGIDLQVDLLPAERSLVMSNDGINDGEIARVAGINRLYPNLVKIDEKLYDYEIISFSNNNIEIKSWEELKPYSVGIVTGWKLVEKNTQISMLTKVKNAELLFKILNNNRVDIIIYERLMGYSIIKKQKLAHVKALEPPLVTVEMFFYLHKKHSSLVPKVEIALKEMKRDGVYDLLFKKMMDTIEPKEQ